MLAAGETVISDRYVASIALDLIRGVPADVLWQLHAALPLPNLAVVLRSSDDVAARRIQVRGLHSRWQSQADNAERESSAYSQVTRIMRQARWPVLVLDTTAVSPHSIVEQIAAAVTL
jgi:dTMP kinase